MINRWTVPEPLAVHEARMDDGSVIVLRRHGNPDGVRIVLSHANGFAADAYYPFWSLLMDRFDIVLFDLRNHGWNPVGSVNSHSIPTFVSDMSTVASEINRCFGPKPAIGVFHSVSGQTAMIEASSGMSSFAGLILFDPFICPSGCDPVHRQRLMDTMQSMVDVARRRRAAFDSVQDFADRLRKAPAFDRLQPGVADLIAQTTTRLVDGSSMCELRCPPEFEARIAEQGYQYASTVKIEALRCPAKVIGSDPVVPHSFLPTVAMSEIVALNYDFIPETTHFLQLEDPEECVSTMLNFVKST